MASNEQQHTHSTGSCCHHGADGSEDHAGHLHGHHMHGLTENIRIAFFLNLSFTIIEIIGAYFTNSMAVLADALHDLGDSLGLGIGWWFQHLSGKKGTGNLTFGYRRLSLAGALINSLVLFVGSLFVLTEAVPRLWSPPEAYAPGMLGLAILGIAVNGLAVLRLQRGNTLNERVLTLHLIEDVLGWVAVLIVSVIMLFVDAPILDPLLCILITLVILWRCAKNLHEVCLLFLEASPMSVDMQTLQDKLETLPGVLSVHDLHLWSLDGDYHLCTLHAVIDASAEVTQVKSTLRIELADSGVNHSTIEIEYEGEECNPCDL